MDEIKKPLQKLGQQLGAARDWDVFTEETWPVLREALDGDPALTLALQEEIDLRRSLAHLEARSALRHRNAQRVLLMLSRCLMQDAAAPPGKSDTGFAELHRQLDDYRAQLIKDLDDLHKLKPEALHALRIVAKKVRYLTEFTASRYDAAAVEKWLKMDEESAGRDG